MSAYLVVIVVTAVATYILTIIAHQFSAREKKIAHEIEHRYGIDDDRFARSLGVLLPPAIVGGNRVTALKNGDAFFPAMLKAIAQAQRTITLETYIYWSGIMGRRFAAALAERAKAGVKVHLLLDWFGSIRMSNALIEIMVSAGVDLRRYHKPRWYTLRRLNNRTHRKLLVVDGRIGFTGGAGIADVWMGNAQDPQHWRDSHYCVEGPCVRQLQGAFMDNWLKAHADVLHGDDYFPPVDAVDDVRAQVFKSSPNEGSESARLLYLLAIAAAEHSIKLGSAYFVPDDLTIEALVAARHRGVEIDVVVPGDHTDSRLVGWASRHRWGALLKAGVRIHEYQPTMYHTKLMVIDDFWVSVGSTNFDNRSFRLNDEVNLNVLDADFARTQSAALEEDISRSRQVTLVDWKRRPWSERLREKVATVLRSQL